MLLRPSDQVLGNHNSGHMGAAPLKGLDCDFDGCGNREARQRGALTPQHQGVSRQPARSHPLGDPCLNSLERARRDKALNGHDDHTALDAYGRAGGFQQPLFACSIRFHSRFLGGCRA